MFLKKFVFILLSVNSVFCFNFNKLIVTSNLDNYKNNCDKLRRNILYTGVGIGSYNLFKPIKTNAEKKFPIFISSPVKLDILPGIIAVFPMIFLPNKISKIISNKTKRNIQTQN